MRYSEIKEIKKELEAVGFDDWRSFIEEYVNETADFDVDGYRFIHQDNIDEIMQEELGSDLYALGCFNDWFLADVLDVDYYAIKAMQEAEAYKAIGMLIISMGKLEKLQKEYARFDGYGDYFDHYDGIENMVDVYYVFRN